jgi:hypothetical protein
MPAPIVPSVPASKRLVTAAGDDSLGIEQEALVLLLQVTALRLLGRNHRACRRVACGASIEAGSLQGEPIRV